MKQVLVQLDDRLADELEQVVPGRSHKRSAFIRRAIARALHEELERRTREAYATAPDEAPGFDPAAWASESEAIHPPVLPRVATAKARTKSRARR